MDINSVLPFLLQNINKDNQSNSENNGNNSANQGKGKGGIDSMELIQSMLKGDGVDNSSIISALAKNSGNPQMATVLSLAETLNKKKPTTQPTGLAPIIPFVNNDIMGKLTKFFAK